jgi:hypothetical protein
MNKIKPKNAPSNKILVGVQAEMALPRMSKSARIAELDLDTAGISKQIRTVMPGFVHKLIRSSPSEPEKAQIFVLGDHRFRELRIENTLADKRGKKVKLKKGAHVEITIAAKPDVSKFDK